MFFRQILPESPLVLPAPPYDFKYQMYSTFFELNTELANGVLLISWGNIDSKHYLLLRLHHFHEPHLLPHPLIMLLHQELPHILHVLVLLHANNIRLPPDQSLVTHNTHANTTNIINLTFQTRNPQYPRWQIYLYIPSWVINLWLLSCNQLVIIVVNNFSKWISNWSIQYTILDPI